MMTEFIIYAISTTHGTEEIDRAQDAQEAAYLVREYRMAYGPGTTEICAYRADKPAPRPADNARLSALLWYGE